jgi:condensin-2 complex subunit H2
VYLPAALWSLCVCLLTRSHRRTAALLIQGSTIIYSKKVEHLYTLLYQTIDFLREQKKTHKKGDDGHGGAVDEEGGAADDEDDFREQEAEFLALDDMQESENIDLDESGGSKTATTLRLLCVPHM